MKPLINNQVKVFVTGFIVLLFLSLSLFWIRFACETSLIENMPDEARQIRITPSGLVPDELENDPNVAHHSSVSTNTIRTGGLIFLGIYDYFIARSPGGNRSNVYYLRGDDEWIYFDKKLGQIVCRYRKTKIMPDKTRSTTYIERYIGPEGISEMPNKTLGRFIEPIIDSQRYSYPKQSGEKFLYDKKLRQFFKIDYDKKTVVKGPKIKKHDYQPIQIGMINKNPFSYPYWLPPEVPITDEEINASHSKNKFKSIIPFEHAFNPGPYLLVLDENGRIDLLDKETLAFAGIAGRLPNPMTYFGSERIPNPKNLSCYGVEPLALDKFYHKDGRLYKMVFNGQPSPERADFKVESEYLGMFVSSVSRNGTGLALHVLDADGKLKHSQYPYTTKYKRHERNTKKIHSVKAVFWDIPWAPFITIIKYSAENLHPPILSLGSYFTASIFEAGSGHRALFLLPNSFIAMIGRDLYGNFAERFLTALWWIMPSIILSIILARCVAKDATIVGLSKNAKTCWLIGTVTFGLAAYITYKLTKPKITLVTCQNCGKPRRPDMEKCHRCKSGWYVPELTPPPWRVIE